MSDNICKNPVFFLISLALNSRSSRVTLYNLVAISIWERKHCCSNVRALAQENEGESLIKGQLLRIYDQYGCVRVCPACSGRQRQAYPTWPWVLHQKIVGRVCCSFLLWCSLLCQPGICLSPARHGAAGCSLPSLPASSRKGISVLAMAGCRIRYIWVLPDFKTLETGFCVFRESPIYWPCPSLCQLYHNQKTKKNGEGNRGWLVLDK